MAVLSVALLVSALTPRASAGPVSAALAEQERHITTMAERADAAVVHPSNWDGVKTAWRTTLEGWQAWAAENAPELDRSDGPALRRIEATIERTSARIADHVRRPPELQRRLAANGALTEYFDSLEPPEKDEFLRIYRLYERQVARRNEEGWLHGDEGNSRVAIENFVRLRGTGYGYPRSLLDSEIPRLQASLRDAPEGGETRSDREKLEKYRKEARRRFGSCGDWASDMAWLLAHANLKLFEAGMTSANLGGDYEHAGTRVRLKARPRRSFVLDAWMEGKPDLKMDDQWLSGRLLVEFGPFQ